MHREQVKTAKREITMALAGHVLTFEQGRELAIHFAQELVSRMPRMPEGMPQGPDALQYLAGGDGNVRL